MKKIDPADYRVKPGHKVNLKDRPTRAKNVYDSTEDYRSILKDHVGQLSSMQSQLYATNRYAVLVILQAMDAAGKDGVIKHVMSGVNPQGTQVYSFKHPGPEELQHDFLWNPTRRLPARGQIGIFNRSYYEEVLILRVHPELLAAEGVPSEKKGGDSVLPDNIWEHRYQSIVGLERHLHRNGTRIVKFFLHLSKGEQKKRFLKRIQDPDKNWKFSMDDIKERGYWKEYMEAYENCLSATSTKDSPWYIVPADDKPSARLIVSKTIVDTLSDLKLSYPQMDGAHVRELQAIRKKLEAE